MSSLAIPNGYDGIRLEDGTHGNRIGGLTSAPNLIAYNHASGVTMISAAHRNSILSNSVFSNTQRG